MYTLRHTICWVGFRKLDGFEEHFVSRYVVSDASIVYCITTTAAKAMKIPIFDHY